MTSKNRDNLNSEPSGYPPQVCRSGMHTGTSRYAHCTCRGLNACRTYLTKPHKQSQLLLVCNSLGAHQLCARNGHEQLKHASERPEICSPKHVISAVWQQRGVAAEGKTYPGVKGTPPPMMATCGLLASTGAGTDVMATATAIAATRDTTASRTIACMCRCEPILNGSFSWNTIGLGFRP